MTTPLSMYPHQMEALDHAKAKNTIVNLPTGMGKTLIAAKLIEHYLFDSPAKKIAFLVPTRALVEQQSKYCRKHCRLLVNTGFPPPVVQKLVGEDQSDWSQSDWDSCMSSSHILLGTAALFQQAFITDKYIDISMFSLIVFDECHNACGNSPMAAVMRDAVAPHQEKGLPGPRILGLTASFVNGSMKNIEKKRRQLETLLLSTIICPDAQTQKGDERFKFIKWSKSKGVEKHKDAIEAHIKCAVQHVGQIKEVGKVIRHCTLVFEEVGCKYLMFYIDKVIVEQIKAKARSLQENQTDVARHRLGNRMWGAIPDLHRELNALRQELEADPVVQQADKLSLKARRLVEILLELFSESKSGYRGIVFVEQVALVSTLAKALNDLLTSMQIQCGAVAGTGSQSEAERQSVLEKFRSGEIQILVATAALEEGIDVSECAFVIRYTSITTTKAHIQGAGRARHPNAVVMYFENDPYLEREKERTLTATARDKTLALTTEELQKAATSINIPFDQRHPYPFQARRDIYDDITGEVNVFNCKQIFNQYCSMTLGASVKPKTMLYKYNETVSGGKLLARVRYPTPSGWVHLAYRDFESFWGKTNLDYIFCAERVKRKSSSEKEEMCFVYMVVVQLREEGFLDSHNRPNLSTGVGIRRNCPLDADWPPPIAINNRVFQSNRGY